MRFEHAMRQALRGQSVTTDGLEYIDATGYPGTPCDYASGIDGVVYAFVGGQAVGQLQVTEAILGQQWERYRRLSRVPFCEAMRELRGGRSVLRRVHKGAPLERVTPSEPLVPQEDFDARWYLDAEQEGV